MTNPAPLKVASKHASHMAPKKGKGKARGFPFTDVGNAQRLVARHGKDLHYCPAWRKWLVWDGKRWKVDDTGEVYRRAKETVRAFYLDARDIKDSGRKKAAIKHAVCSEYESRIGAMFRLAQSESGIPVIPDQLDRDPYLLNCPNGTIDLKTGKLRAHRRADLITKLAPVAFDPQATCPQFDAFLSRIMNGDGDLVQYLQRVTGYALTGDVGEKAIFFLCGDGNNGKTTFLEAIRGALGDYAGQIPIQSLMAKNGDGIPNDIARLKGLRFVTSSEAEQGRKLAEPKVKLLTGMGRLQARFLYGEFFEFDATFKIFMDANYKPEIEGEYVDTGWSGAKASRPELDRLMKDAAIRRFDAVLVYKLDRFGRSVRNCLDGIEALGAHGVRFLAVSQSIDTDQSNPTARLLLHILASVAEFERELIRERTLAGVRQARAKGKPIGRPKRVFRRDEVLRLRGEGLSWRTIAQTLGVPVMTVVDAHRECTENVVADGRSDGRKHRRTGARA